MWKFSRSSMTTRNFVLAPPESELAWVCSVIVRVSRFCSEPTMAAQNAIKTPINAIVSPMCLLETAMCFACSSFSCRELILFFTVYSLWFNGTEIERARRIGTHRFFEIYRTRFDIDPELYDQTCRAEILRTRAKRAVRGRLTPL